MRAPDFTGRSGDREPCEPRFSVSRCRLPHRMCSALLGGIFFVSVLRTKKCVLSLAVLPISRSPCKISIVRRGLHPLRKLLRFRPQFGSPRCEESLDGHVYGHARGNQLRDTRLVRRASTRVVGGEQIAVLGRARAAGAELGRPAHRLVRVAGRRFRGVRQAGAHHGRRT